MFLYGRAEPGRIFCTENIDTTVTVDILGLMLVKMLIRPTTGTVLLDPLLHLHRVQFGVICGFLLAVYLCSGGWFLWRRQNGGRMCEGPSRICGPIPPDPTLSPDYYKLPFSARGRLEGSALKVGFSSDPLHPVSNPYSACQVQPAPRIRPSGKDFLEKGQKGMLSLLLQLEGLSLDRRLPVERKESKDHEKENVRRIKEIQKKYKEKERAQEHSKPKPVKALWKSQKYENVESKVKAKLQESSPPPNPEALKFLRAYSRCGPGIKPCRSLSPGPARMKTGADTEDPEALGVEIKPAGEEGAVAQRDGGAAAKPARSQHTTWSYQDARGPAAGDPRQSEAEPGAAGKGPGDAASEGRHSQHAEEAGGAGEEALPNRRGHQNFLKAQGLHQAGCVS
ncbi:enkurin domain-containing protein 1 isoform X2 [Pezoporus occidentalis]|uniref:enkurin domain-containing protein 1 isoform X2 n=1 Tax=Pezoporus occidentalis TaxID=407982 RepID=UPI002F9105A6